MVSHADEDGEKERIPGDAAARTAQEAVETPEPAAEEFREEDAKGIVPLLREQRTAEHLRDRHEDEDGDDNDNEADRADDELVATDGAARGKPEGEQEQEGAAYQQRTPAHAILAVIKLSEEQGQPLPLEAAQANAEALKQEIGEAHRAGRDQQRPEEAIGFLPAPQQKRREKQTA